MIHRRIILRETLVSMVINAVLSLLFFLLVFGRPNTVAIRLLGPDFLPQAFMVAFMGSLIPGLLVRRHGRSTPWGIASRALLLGIGAMLIAGGGAFLVCRASGAAVLSLHSAIVIKVLFGTFLAAAITPIAVRATISSPQEA